MSAESEWRPISTAPKDGTILTMRQKGLAPFLARWNHCRWQPISFDHGLPADEWWDNRAPPWPVAEDQT